MTHLLAIDGGSQSTKVSVVAADGRVLARARVPLRAYALGLGGRAVHPDDDLWDSLAQATRAVLAAFDGEIAGVGLCGIRFCRALVGADARLVEPVLSWMDDRVSRPMEPTPGVETVCSAGGYLALRLTGERRDSAAAYRGMWPLADSGDAWASGETAYAETGMPRDLLPELVPPGGVLGQVSAEASAATGIAAGVPVIATANDKAVEALGAGLVDPGTTLLSLGTYVAAMRLGDPDARPGAWVNAAAIPGRHLLESAGIRRGMWTVSWLQQLVTAAAPDLVDADAVRAWLQDGAAQVPPGCGGLMTVPDWLPPGDAPHRRGVIVGLDGGHGAHHLHRSILEGLALTMRAHTAALGESDRLVVAGGGSRSDLMMRIVADVLDRPAERAAEPDAAGLGAAICAAVGAGVHPGFAEAVAAMVRPGEVVEPDPAGVAAYRGVRRAYDGMVAGLDPVLAATYAD